MVNQWMVFWALCAGIIIGFFLGGCVFGTKDR